MDSVPDQGGRFRIDAVNRLMRTSELFAKDYRITEYVVPFIRERHKKWHKEPDQKVINYLAWFYERDCLAISMPKEIHGICCIRLFDKLEDFLEPFAFDPSGQFCMVDLLVATTPNAIADCFEFLFKRWGRQEIIIWERLERTCNSLKAPRMYTWEQYLRLTRRLTYGLTPSETK